VPRRPDLSQDELRLIEKELFDTIQEDLQDREAWLRKRVRSFEDWIDPNKTPKNWPWENASNITPPLIAREVRKLHARLVGAIFNADPWVHVLPVRTANMDAARRRELFLNEQVRNEIPGFYRELNTALLEAVVQGTSFVKIWFERSRETQAEWLLVERFETLGTEEFGRTDQQILHEIASQISRTQALGDHTYEIDHLVDGGFKTTSRVTISRDEQGLRRDQISVTLEREVFTEETRIRNLDVEDLVFPANATSLQPEDCHHVSELSWAYPNQIRRRQMLEHYTELTEEDLERLDRLTGHAHGLSQEVTQVREAVDEFQGVELVEGLSGIREGKVLIVTSCFPWDVNDDGLDEQMIFHWIPALRKVVQWEYLTVRYGHGRRPYVPFIFTPLTGRIYGIGLAEMLAELQDEAATIFNQMNDRESVTNAPYILVEPGVGIAPSVFRGAPPGSVFTVRNVDRVRPLEWQKNPHAGIPALNLVSAYAEQIAGAGGEIGGGNQPTRPNAPRTARGTLALLSEANVVIDTHVLNTQFISLQELIRQIDGLNRQYLPEARIFSIIGEREPQEIRREDFREQVKFFFSGNTSNTNIQVKQTIAQFIFQTLITNPIFTGAYIQMPEMAIRSVHRLTEFFVREYLPGKDSRLLVPPVEAIIQEATQVQQAQTQGMEEAQSRQEEEDEAQGMLQILTAQGQNQGGTRGGAGTGSANIG
jgi:hypothetical protein